MTIYDPISIILNIEPNLDFDWSDNPSDIIEPLKVPVPTPGMTGLRHSAETKALLSSIRKGKKRTWSVPAKENWSKRRVYTCEWEVTEPDGVVIVLDNLKKYCREKNLNMGNLTYYGKSKGYSVKKLGKSKNLNYLKDHKT